MTTEIDEIQHYQASPDVVFTMLSDADFIKQKCLASGSIEADAEVIDDGGGRISLVARRVLPAKIPGFAKKFVGDTITLTETQNWRPPASDGSRAAGFVVDFGNNPISFTGAVEMKPNGDETTVETKGMIKCSVPFVGGKIENLALEWIQKYINKEQRVGNDWLDKAAS
ncbi:MAG: DUF2505 domain-containing protein [Actinomycetia bacterium]|nr:DUF2505 domain-containing protein [Actinomycetes bacterium]